MVFRAITLLSNLETVVIISNLADHCVVCVCFLQEEPKAETVKQNLPKLVDVIHKLFRSTNKTVITKEELLHKMIACQIDIMDRSKDSLFISKCVLLFHFSLFSLARLTVTFLFCLSLRGSGGTAKVDAAIGSGLDL